MHTSKTCGACMRKGKRIRIVGHTLVLTGAPHKAGADTAWVLAEGKVGRAMCTCGMVSPILAHMTARKQWHAQHRRIVRWELESMQEGQDG